MRAERLGLDPFTDGWDFPMVVVTTSVAAQGAARRAGCLVGFSTQCSMNPARFLVCLSDKNHTFRVAGAAAHLAVHALRADQRPLASLFGEQTGDDVDKFTRCAWRPGPHGMPILRECPRWFVGAVIARVDLGDHVGFVLEPVAASAASGRSGPALMLSSVRNLRAGHDA